MAQTSPAARAAPRALPRARCGPASLAAVSVARVAMDPRSGLRPSARARAVHASPDGRRTDLMTGSLRLRGPPLGEACHGDPLVDAATVNDRAVVVPGDDASVQNDTPAAPAKAGGTREGGPPQRVSDAGPCDAAPCDSPSRDAGPGSGVARRGATGLRPRRRVRGATAARPRSSGTAAPKPAPRRPSRWRRRCPSRRTSARSR